MRNLFDAQELAATIQRIDNLTADSQPRWGKMSVAQMLAHCNVAYDSVFTNKYPKPNAFKKFFIKLLVKPAVVGPKPYPKNGRTAPHFIIQGNRDFEEEKKKLTDYLGRTQELGSKHFEGWESHSFGPLTTKEWNMMFSKHLDHHLRQFGV